MRRRLNLGCALVSGPRLVLLDEPTVAVDPQSRAHIFDAVRALRARAARRSSTRRTTSRRPRTSATASRSWTRARWWRAGRCPSCSRCRAPPRSSSCACSTPPETVAPIEAVDGVRKVEAVGNELRIFTTRAQQVLPRVYRAVSGARPRHPPHARHARHARRRVPRAHGEGAARLMRVTRPPCSRWCRARLGRREN